MDKEAAPFFQLSLKTRSEQIFVLEKDSRFHIRYSIGSTYILLFDAIQEKIN